MVFNTLTADINETYTGCSGDGYSYTSPSGTVYDEANPVGSETLQDTNGCDYDVNVTFSFNALTADINEVATYCEGSGASYTSPSGTVYNEGNPSGSETLQDGNGCDYTVTVALTFDDCTDPCATVTDYDELYTGCSGDGYTVTVNGNVYDETTPTGTENVVDGNGCAYVVTINLVFNALTADINETYIGCSGDGYTYTSPSGTVYDEGNPSGTETLQDGNGCDYDVNVNLVFNTLTADINETYTGCSGDGYSYTSPSGTVYDEANPVGSETLQDTNGCDYDVNVTFSFNALTADINEVATYCEGSGASYTSPSGTVYNEGNPSGSETLQDGNGCDYTVTVALTFDDCTDPCATVTDYDELYTGCSGDGYTVTVNGNVYDETTPTGTENVVDGNGCAYVVTINLVFNALTADINETYIGCSGDGYTYTSPSGAVYDEGNPLGLENLTDANGCAYVVTVDLTYNTPDADINETYTGCSGDGYTYTSPSGTVYDEANPTGTETLQDANGCDYTVTVNLTFDDCTDPCDLVTDYTESYTGCSGDSYSITVNGTIYDEGNPTGTENITDGNGCTYVVTINLVFNTLTADINETYTGCSGDGYTYTSPSGTVYDESNPVGLENLTDSNGCSYTVNVTLIFNTLTADINEVATYCEGSGASFTSPSGTVYDESNPTGTETLQDGNGCDYTITVNLTFNDCTDPCATVTDYTESYLGCSGDGYSVIVNGTVYDEGNPAGVENITDGNGCTYVVTVDLDFTPLPQVLIANGTSPADCSTANGSATIQFVDVPEDIYEVNYDGGSWTGVSVDAAGFATIPDIPVGTYSNITIAVNGCVSVQTTNLVISAAVIPPAPNANSVTYCEDDTISDITVTGEPTASFIWYADAALIDVIDIDANFTPDGTVGTQTVYVIQIVDGCESQETQVDITINPTPDAPTAASPAAYCDGDAIADITASGEVGATFTWYSDASLLVVIDSDDTFSPSGALGTETVYVTQTVAGCESAATQVDISVTSCGCGFTLTVDAGADASICENETFTTAGSFGGDASAASWSTSGDGSFDASDVYTPGTGDIATGNVTLTYTTDDPDGADPLCSAVSDDVVLVINSLQTPTFSINDTYCSGTTTDALPAISDNGINGTWAPATIDNSASGTYTFTPAAGECSNSYTLNVTINETPTLSAIGSNPTGCGLTDGTISLNITGVPPGDHDIDFVGGTWFDVTIDATGNGLVSGLGVGDYNNITISYNGCTSALGENITLSYPDAPNVPSALSKSYCFGDVIENVTALGEPTANFTWYADAALTTVISTEVSGANNEVWMPDNVVGTQTVYVVQMVDNCTSDATMVVIEIADCACPAIDIDQVPDVCNNVNVVVDLDDYATSAAPGNWTITSAPVGNNPAFVNGSFIDFDGVDAGTYELTYTLDPLPDNNTCDSFETVSFTVNSSAEAGTGNNITVFNNAGATSINLTDLLIGADSGGVFSLTGTSPQNSGYVNGNDIFTFAGIEEGTYQFNYNVASACGNDISTIIIQVFENENDNIIIPTAFSPNNDGINDYFTVIPFDHESFSLEVYNRWGKKVYAFEGQADLGWDGFYNSELQELGVYMYIINVKYLDGREVVEKGTVTLIK